MTFWCDDLKVGDKLTILRDGQKYECTVVEYKFHPRVECHSYSELSGCYTFSRGCKWGATDTWILEAIT